MPAVDERLGDLVEHFYRAFLAADREALAKVVSPETAWIVRLDTALSGAHVGPDGMSKQEHSSLRRKLRAGVGPRPGHSRAPPQSPTVALSARASPE
jgi:ketosteroid isomerase-like protein